MFCEYCGKNIYDLKKCPFCNNGEKAEDENTEVKQEATKVKEEHPIAEATKQTGSENEDANTCNPYEPTKETKRFTDRLKKECKAFKAVNTADLIRMILSVAFPVLCILVFWIQNSNERFGYILLNGVFNALPFIYVLFWVGILLNVAMLIIFIVQMKKKNASNKELFKCTRFTDDSDYSYGFAYLNGFQEWQAISFKYEKKSFAMSIVIWSLNTMQWSANFIFGLIFLAVGIPASREYGLFTVGFGNALASKEMLGVVVILIIVNVGLWITKTVLSRTCAKSHIRLVEQLKAGKLEN